MVAEGEMGMGTQHGPEEQENYSFMQESIKDERINLKKIVRSVLKLAGKGLVFGLAACIGFFALRPWAEEIFQKESKEIEIPGDEEQSEQEGTEDANGQEDAALQPQALTIENYRELNTALIQVASEAEKSMVSVKGIQQDESWEDAQNVSPNVTSGVIVGDNGGELLIVANYSSMKNAHLFQVELVDGTKHEATMKQKDGNIDLAVFSIAKSGITETTMNRIKIVSFGNSNVIAQGRTLIAVGSPFGYEGGMGYGIASTVNASVICADGKYNIIVTDMPASESGSGALFDSNAKLIGIIDTRTYQEDDTNTLTAIGISSIKSEIEMMSNGKSVPYVGVIGTVITEVMSETYGMPAGLFVEEVEVDSPAMKAGIQSGDIITKVDGENITSITEYHKVIIGQEAGKTIKFTGQRLGVENYVDIKFNVTVGIKQ